MGHSYAQNMQRLVEQCREADQPWPTTEIEAERNAKDGAA